MEVTVGGGWGWVVSLHVIVYCLFDKNKKKALHEYIEVEIV